MKAIKKTGLSYPACKCCGGMTVFFAHHDFSRTCEDRKAPVFAATGIKVSYQRCLACGFVFTSHFDTWAKKEMTSRIYNADYILADPDFAAARPKHIAGELAKTLGPAKSAISLLDYGGGNAGLAEELRQRGF